MPNGLTEIAMWAFLCVFVRLSAMLMVSPVFGGQQTPVGVRVFTILSISGALAAIIQPKITTLPEHLGSMALALALEAGIGLIIGSLIHAALHAIQMAGSLIDLQIGLGMAQVLNPSGGQSVTIVAQFKYLLAVVIFLVVNGHHSLFEAFVASYQVAPGLGLDPVRVTLLSAVGQFCLLALQVAAPVAAVSLVVDAALGLINRAVPQMQPFLVGIPAKIGVGVLALGIALPVTVAAVKSGVDVASKHIVQVFQGAK